MGGVLKNLLSLIISIAVIGVQTISAATQTVAVLPSDGVLNANELELQGKLVHCGAWKKVYGGLSRKKTEPAKP